jgi:hypothetical protein
MTSHGLTNALLALPTCPRSKSMPGVDRGATWDCNAIVSTGPEGERSAKGKRLVIVLYVSRGLNDSSWMSVTRHVT